MDAPPPLTECNKSHKRDPVEALCAGEAGVQDMGDSTKFICVEEVIMKQCSSSKTWQEYNEELTTGCPKRQRVSHFHCQSPGATSTVLATPTTPITAASEDHETTRKLLGDELVRERTSTISLIVEMKLKKLELMDALKREKIEKENLKRQLEALIQELERMKNEKLELVAVSCSEKVETIEEEMQQQVQLEEQKEPSNNFFKGQGSIISCSNGCLCTHCFALLEECHCPGYAAQRTSRRLSYCKFKNEMKSHFDIIKFGLTPKDVLELEVIKSIQSDLCENDKLYCAQFYLNKHFSEEKPKALNAYCKFLVDNDINVELVGKSIHELAEKHHSAYPNLFITDIRTALSQYRMCMSLFNISKFDKENVLSKELKDKLKEKLDKMFPQDSKKVGKVVDRLERMLES